MKVHTSSLCEGVKAKNIILDLFLTPFLDNYISEIEDLRIFDDFFCGARRLLQEDEIFKPRSPDEYSKMEKHTAAQIHSETYGHTMLGERQASDGAV